LEKFELEPARTVGIRCTALDDFFKTGNYVKQATTNTGILHCVQDGGVRTLCSGWRRTK
jgi:hypothetical protein